MTVLKRASNSVQFALRLRGGRPVAVSSRTIRRATRRALAAHPEGLRSGISYRQYLEDVSLLDQLRKKGRQMCRVVPGYAATPQGRKLYREIDQLIARIEARESRLCV